MRIVRLVSISIRSTPKGCLWLPAAIFRRVPATRSITVIAGQLQCSVRVRAIKGSNIVLSQDIARYLKVTPTTISVSYEKGTIRLGPFVAIVAPMVSRERLFGDQTQLVKDMIALSKKVGVVAYVAPFSHFQWNHQQVRGLTIGPEGQWVTQLFPMPDFLIQRTVSKSSQMHKTVVESEERLLARYRTAFLSRRIGGKWDVHRRLATQSEISKYLPETVRIESPNDVHRLLDRHQVVYVKPSYGTQGMGVRKISKERGRYRWTERDATGRSRSVSLSRARLNVKLSNLARRGVPYIAQRGIDLLTLGGERIVDFRWLVQKDAFGSWDVTARIARCAPSRSITTNIHTGGEAMDAESLLERIEAETSVIRDRDELLSRIDQLALIVARNVENAVGPMGELGVDVAIGQDGELWILECNPRPGRRMLRSVSMGIRKLSLLRPLEYAKYTTGFTT